MVSKPQHRVSVKRKSMSESVSVFKDYKFSMFKFHTQANNQHAPKHCVSLFFTGGRGNHLRIFGSLQTQRELLFNNDNFHNNMWLMKAIKPNAAHSSCLNVASAASMICMNSLLLWLISATHTHTHTHAYTVIGVGHISRVYLVVCKEYSFALSEFCRIWIRECFLAKNAVISLYAPLRTV